MQKKRRSRIPNQLSSRASRRSPSCPESSTQKGGPIHSPKSIQSRLVRRAPQHAQNTVGCTSPRAVVEWVSAHHVPSTVKSGRRRDSPEAASTGSKIVLLVTATSRTKPKPSNTISAPFHIDPPFLCPREIFATLILTARRNKDQLLHPRIPSRSSTLTAPRPPKLERRQFSHKRDQPGSHNPESMSFFRDQTAVGDR